MAGMTDPFSGFANAVPDFSDASRDMDGRSDPWDTVDFGDWRAGGVSGEYLPPPPLDRGLLGGAIGVPGVGFDVGQHDAPCLLLLADIVKHNETIAYIRARIQLCEIVGCSSDTMQTLQNQLIDEQLKLNDATNAAYGNKNGEKGKCIWW